MQEVNFLGARAGTSGVYNGLFLGEAYANYGPVGLLISSIHVPILFALLNIIFNRIKKTPITIAMFTYFTMNFLMTLYGGYFDYVFSSIWTIIIIVSLAMTLFIKIGSKIKFFNKKQFK